MLGVVRKQPGRGKTVGEAGIKETSFVEMKSTVYGDLGSTPLQRVLVVVNS